MEARSAVQRAGLIALAPFSLLSGAKSFRDNPVIGSRRLNQLGLHVGRIRLADALTGQRRQRLGRQLSAADRAHYAEHGYVIRENLLPAPKFEELRQEVYGSTWPLLEMRQGSSITRRVVLNRAALRRSHPALEQLLAYAEIRRLIRYVAGTGAEPIFSLQAILSGLPSPTADPQTHLHADTFHSIAKAWFFLHDVEASKGPFAYVPGSHRMTPARLVWEHQQSLGAARHPIKYHARGSFRVSDADLRTMGLPPPRLPWPHAQCPALLPGGALRLVAPQPLPALERPRSPQPAGGGWTDRQSADGRAGATQPAGAGQDALGAQRSGADRCAGRRRPIAGAATAADAANSPRPRPQRLHQSSPARRCDPERPIALGQRWQCGELGL
jgi:hypothetical protein